MVGGGTSIVIPPVPSASIRFGRYLAVIGEMIPSTRKTIPTMISRRVRHCSRSSLRASGPKTGHGRPPSPGRAADAGGGGEGGLPGAAFGRALSSPRACLARSAASSPTSSRKTSSSEGRIRSRTATGTPVAATPPEDLPAGDLGVADVHRDRERVVRHLSRPGRVAEGGRDPHRAIAEARVHFDSGRPGGRTR